jgi:hypothetical protein
MFVSFGYRVYLSPSEYFLEDTVKLIGFLLRYDSRATTGYLLLSLLCVGVSQPPYSLPICRSYVCIAKQSITP